MSPGENTHGQFQHTISMGGSRKEAEMPEGAISHVEGVISSFSPNINSNIFQ